MLTSSSGSAVSSASESTPAPPSGAGTPAHRGARFAARRLAATYYLYVFLDEFVLLYPLYALLFTDTGLSVAQVSSLFVIWSVTCVVLEVPSGVLADVVSRRLLLVLAPLLGGIGFGLWVAAPAYWVFALGFVLWGARGALQSGAAEALLYEELDRLDQADRYGRVLGRSTTVGLVAGMLATLAAGPVFVAGGYRAVGAASVLASLGCAVAALALPEHRSDSKADSAADSADPAGAAAAGDPGYIAVLRAGLAEARGDRAVRQALLLLPLIAAIWTGLEEYVPLLAGDVAPVRFVPLLVLMVGVGVALGGLATPVGQRLGPRRFAGLLAAAAVLLAAGALSGRPAGFVLIAVAFGALQLAQLVADVRLQERITGPSRATVTSLAGLGTEVISLGVFGGYALLATLLGNGMAVALLAMPYLCIAVAYYRTTRDRASGPVPAEPVG